MGAGGVKLIAGVTGETNTHRFSALTPWLSVFGSGSLTTVLSTGCDPGMRAMSEMANTEIEVSPGEALSICGVPHDNQAMAGTLL